MLVLLVLLCCFCFVLRRFLVLWFDGFPVLGFRSMCCLLIVFCSLVILGFVGLRIWLVLLLCLWFLVLCSLFFLVLLVLFLLGLFLVLVGLLVLFL